MKINKDKLGATGGGGLTHTALTVKKSYHKIKGFAIMKNNERVLNVTFSKSGSGSISSKLSIPKDWINTMELNSENRQVIATFDEKDKTIIIKAKAGKD